MPNQQCQSTEGNATDNSKKTHAKKTHKTHKKTTKLASVHPQKLCTQLWHTTEHRTIPIVFHPILQTITTEPLRSAGRKGTWEGQRVYLYDSYQGHWQGAGAGSLRRGSNAFSLKSPTVDKTGYSQWVIFSGWGQCLDFPLVPRQWATNPQRFIRNKRRKKFEGGNGQPGVHLENSHYKTRNPLKFAGVPQTTGPISATRGPKFTILWGHLEQILLLNKLFSNCRYVPQLRRYSPTKLCDGAQMANFGRLFGSCIFSEPRATRFRAASEIRTKATPCVEVW